MKMQLESLDQRQMQMVAYGTMLLIVVALVSYLLLPQWKAYRAAAASLTLLQSSVVPGENLDLQLDGLRSEVNEMTRSLSGDAANLPTKQMEAFVIGRLQSISWGNDMTLVSVQPKEGQPVNQFRELIFDVELSGDYFKFFDWLHDISDELGFVVVKRFDIAVDRNVAVPGGSPGLRVRLTMAAYRSQDA
jgi:Tfp pilus assembly protein PilO